MTICHDSNFGLFQLSENFQLSLRLFIGHFGDIAPSISSRSSFPSISASRFHIGLNRNFNGLNFPVFYIVPTFYNNILIIGNHRSGEI